MKKFIAPEIEVMKMSVEDVITTSVPSVEGDGEFGGGGNED